MESYFTTMVFNKLVGLQADFIEDISTIRELRRVLGLDDLYELSEVLLDLWQNNLPGIHHTISYWSGHGAPFTWLMWKVDQMIPILRGVTDLSHQGMRPLLPLLTQIELECNQCIEIIRHPFPQTGLEPSLGLDFCTLTFFAVAFIFLVILMAKTHLCTNRFASRRVVFRSNITSSDPVKGKGGDPIKPLPFITAYSPLEQFAIIPLIPIHIGNPYLSFTNSSPFMPPTIGLVLFLVNLVTSNGGHSVPNAWQSLVEMIHDFVPNLVNE